MSHLIPELQEPLESLIVSVVGHVLSWGSFSSQLALSQLRDLIYRSVLVLRSSRNSFKSKEHVSAHMHTFFWLYSFDWHKKFYSSLYIPSLMYIKQASPFLSKEGSSTLLPHRIVDEKQ